MLKTTALQIVGGGSVSQTARNLGISYQAVYKWPDELTSRIENHVLAYQAKRHLPAEVLGGTHVSASEPLQRVAATLAQRPA